MQWTGASDDDLFEIDLYYCGSYSFCFEQVSIAQAKQAESNSVSRGTFKYRVLCNCRLLYSRQIRFISCSPQKHVEARR